MWIELLCAALLAGFGSYAGTHFTACQKFQRSALTSAMVMIALAYVCLQLSFPSWYLGLILAVVFGAMYAGYRSAL